MESPRIWELPPSALRPCIGTVDTSRSCHLCGVPPSGGPDRLKPELQTGGFMESPLSLSRMHWAYEPGTGETAPPTCCRHLAGSAILRWVCRQDAGSTLQFIGEIQLLNRPS